MERIKAFGSICIEVQAAALKKLAEVQNDSGQRVRSFQPTPAGDGDLV
jgi:hypothetical protein